MSAKELRLAVVGAVTDPEWGATRQLIEQFLNKKKLLC